MDTSLMSRAKNALQTVAVKAERIITDFKEELKTEFGRSADTSIHDSDGFARGINYSSKASGARKISQEEIQSAIPNVSKYDEGTSKLQDVPKRMKEREFLRYCSMAVNLIKQDAYNSNAHTDNGNPYQGSSMCASQSESPKKDLSEESYTKIMSVTAIPSSKLLRRLAAVIEIGSTIHKVKDLEAIGKIGKEFLLSGGLVSSIAALKNSLIRESKESSSLKCQEIQGIVASMFESDLHQDGDSTSSESWCQGTHSKIPEEIHGVPPRTFVSHLAEVMGSMDTGQMMSELWYGLLSELRRNWEDEKPIPRLPTSANPDLRYCILHQKLQVINCCIARRKHHAAHLALLDNLTKGADDIYGSSEGGDSYYASLDASGLFIRGKEGQLLLRLGADCPAANLRMLETGEPVYAPVTQEGPILTEDLIKETEELVLRTGSVGAGCSQLLSDMQAFKAANPGCLLEDFVRWYSPLDWRQDPGTGPSSTDLNPDSGSRGFLSTRMQCEGNLWQELWASAKPIPAAKQAPLFYEDLAVESTLNGLEDINPAELFEQLFKAILSTGFAVVRSSPSCKNHFASQLKEWEELTISKCNKEIRLSDLEELCQVYEAMENMWQCQSPDVGALHSEGIERPKLIAIAMERGTDCHNPLGNEHEPLRRLGHEQEASFLNEDKLPNIFIQFLETRSSLPDRRCPLRPSPSVKEEKPSILQENDWTFV